MGPTVAVRSRGFWVRDGRTGDTVELPCPGACSGPDNWDWDGLERLTRELKAKTPDERWAILAGEADIAVEVWTRALQVLTAPGLYSAVDIRVVMTTRSEPTRLAASGRRGSSWSDT